MLVNPKKWLQFIEGLEKSEIWFPTGLLTIFLGSFMVDTHNIWEWSPRLITTCIAWIALFKGTTYLTCPQKIFQITKKSISETTYLRFAGVFVIFLGSTILYFSRT